MVFASFFMALALSASAPTDDQSQNQAATVEFVSDPEVEGPRNEGSVQLRTYLTVRARVRVLTADAQPVVGERVRLSASSGSGVFAAGESLTDGSGRAEPVAAFAVPPGDLRLLIQACLADQPDRCTRLERATTRDWFDLDVSVSGSHSAIGFTPTVGRGFRLVNQQYFLTARANARVQVNLLETLREWRYSRVSAYAALPIVLVQSTGTSAGFTGLPFGTNHQSLETGRGIGDARIGVNAVLRGMVFIDVAYDSQTAAVNPVDRTFGGGPQYLAFGDGFSSVDTAVEVRKFLTARGPIVFASGMVSTPFERGGSRVARRGVSYSSRGGVGLLLRQDAAVLFHGGVFHFGGMFGRGVFLEPRTQPVFGVSFIPLTRRDQSLELSASSDLVGGSGGLQTGFSVALTWRAF